MQLPHPPPAVDILILGAGWTSTFLIPLCHTRSVSYAATTRTGRDSTILFTFNPASDDVGPYHALPDARTVVITFPIDVEGAATRLVRLYKQSRVQPVMTGWVLLGTTGIWDGTRKKDRDVTAVANKWYDRHSPFILTPRAAAEEELLMLHPEFPVTVLNLAGLWGGTRDMRNWVGRVAPSKDVLRHKGSIHMVHGTDLARALLAIHTGFHKAAGQRWILTDGRLYDWWDLASAWGAPGLAVAGGAANVAEGAGAGNADGGGDAPRVAGNVAGADDDAGRGPHARWVRELMREAGVRALPRGVEVLGRALDSTEFWDVFGLSPVRARLEREVD